MKFTACLLLLIGAVDAARKLNEIPELLVGNTRADNLVSVSDEVVEEFVSVPSPDHPLMYDGSLYISGGDTVENSAIYKYEDDETTVFAQGGGLIRPYGFAFYEGIIYVASFRTDQILTYDAATGEYIGVFAQGDGTEEGLCNGPNHIAILDGMMYVTTQGSTVITGELQYLFPSQILKYDIATGDGSVFAPSPPPMAGGLGFISMLGCQIYEMADGTKGIMTTDFAGGLRAYDLEGNIISAIETTYVPGASTGALAIDQDGGIVYVPGFFNETTPGVVQRFSLADGTNLDDDGVFVEDLELVRPIGIMYTTAVVTDPPSSAPSDAPTSEPDTSSTPSGAPTSEPGTSSAPSDAPTSEPDSAGTMIFNGLLSVLTSVGYAAVVALL